MSTWSYIGLYAGLVVLSPFIYWLLWFIAMFVWGYIGSNRLDDGDLNYFSTLDDGDWLAINFFGAWLLWPFGWLCASVAFIVVMVISFGSFIAKTFDSYFGVGSPHGNPFDFTAITAKINRSVKAREERQLEESKKAKQKAKK